MERLSSSDVIYHASPPETQEKHQAGYMHRLDIRDVNGQDIGFADYIYLGKPFPFYYLGYMRVHADHRGNRYGSELITTFNQLLITKGRTGILRDIIDDTKPAHGVYSRYGWEPIKGIKGNWHIFNPPKGTTPAKIEMATHKAEVSYDRCLNR